MRTFQEWQDEALKVHAEVIDFVRRLGAATDALEGGAAQLREGRFTVVVAGEFKKGKSSLLNALLEETGLFPVDLEVTTNLVTTAAYGPEERITVLLGERGGETAKRISREEIPDYVTEQRNPTRTRKDEARMLVIETPNPRLREGLVLVDTPGVGGLSVGHTDITYAFIPTADAVIFTSDALTPLTTDELDFVRRIAEHTRLILFAITKIDAKLDWEAVVANDRAKLAVALDRPADDLVVIPVSSRLKLDHLGSGDPDALTDSNFPALEAALWALIAENQGFVVVVRALHELDTILAELDRPLQAEFQGYAQNANADAQKRVAELERALRQQEARVAELMNRDAPWRQTLRAGMQRLREDAAAALGARLKEVRGGVGAYLEDPRRLENPATITQAIQADVNSAIMLTGNAFSEKAAALHSALVRQMGLELPPFEVAPLGLEGPEMDAVQPVRTGWWEKAVEATKSAKFSAQAGSTVLGVLGAAVGGALGLLAGGVGMGPGALWGLALGASMGGLPGAATGWKRRKREIRERDEAATRRAVGRVVTNYLSEVESAARKMMANALRELASSVEASLEALLQREQKTLAATQEALAKGRAATRSEAAEGMARLRAPIAELARHRARARALVERIAAERAAAAPAPWRPAEAAEPVGP
jgi:L-fucose mutarotase/ribose pyranase (RbsD/FucU family)